MSNKLTDKQEQFCKEYIIDFNATRAAKKAGYSEKTSQVTGSENLSKPIIQDYIASLMKKREERTEITADMVVQELAKVAFADIRELYDETRLLLPHELSDKTAATISSFKTKREGDAEEGFYEVEEYKRYDKMKALEVLGKHLGMFIEKQEVNLTGQVVTMLPPKDTDN